MFKSLFYTCLCLVTYPALSQSAATSTAEEKAIKATIERLFEGMRKGDSTLVRSTFYKNARLQTALTDKTGKPILHDDSIDAFVKAVGTPHTEQWDERLQSYEIRIDDNLATVWTPYEFYIDQKFSHKGVNAFQLFRSEVGWKIIHITDTRRKK